jgi:ABC-type proline/glycine betaine transport system permease subunit
MKKTWQISIYALMLLGFIHVVCIPLFYSQFNADAVWFISGGFFLILQGFTNILSWQLQTKFGYLLATIANFISLILVLILLWMMGKSQAYVGTLLALLALVGSFYYWRNPTKTSS